MPPVPLLMPPGGPPAPVPPPAAVVYLAANCSATRLTQGSAGFDADCDWWSVPDEFPVIRACKGFLHMDGIAGSYLMEGCGLLAVVLPPCSLAATPAVRGVSVGRGTLTNLKMQGVVLVLANLGAFEEVFTDVRDYYLNLRVVITAAPQVAMSSLVLKDVDVCHLAPWGTAAILGIAAIVHVPGRAAVAARVASRGRAAVVGSPRVIAIPGRAAVAPVSAVGCEPSLEFLFLAVWAAFQDTGPFMILPLEALCVVLLLLGARDHASARSNASSVLRLAAETLLGGICSHYRGVGGAAPSAAWLAASLPAFVRTVRLPVRIRSPSCTPVAAMQDLQDAIVFHSRGHAQPEVAARRVRNLGHGAPMTKALLESFPPTDDSITVIAAQLDRLSVHTGVPGTERAAGQWLAAALDLEPFLAGPQGNGEFFHSLLASGVTGTAVVEGLLADCEAISAIPLGGGSKDVGQDDATERVTMRESAWAEVLHSKAFCELRAAFLTAEGCKLWELANLSGSMLVTRFVCRLSKDMLHRSSVFQDLLEALPYRHTQVEQALTMDATTGMVPASLEPFSWPTKQAGYYFSGHYEKMDVVNASEGGSLAVNGLLHGGKFAYLDPQLHYVEPAVLEAMKRHWLVLTTLRGYPASPSSGYSIIDLLDVVIDFVNRASMLRGEEIRTEWLTLAAQEVPLMLKEAGEQERALISATSPLNKAFDGFAQDDCRLVRVLSTRLKQAESVVLVQQAFPSWFSADVMPVPGVNPTSPFALVLAGALKTGGAGGSGGGGGGGGAVDADRALHRVKGVEMVSCCLTNP